MPWTPADAKKKYRKLTKRQSEVWSKVANQALENGDDEATAIKKANAAVSRMRKSETIGEAAASAVEIGRAISSANLLTLKNSFKAMQDAMAIIAPLIAEDADEEVSESQLAQLEIPAELLQETVIQKWELVNVLEATKILAQSDSYDSIKWAVQAALRSRALSDALSARVTDGSFSYDDYYYNGCYPYVRDLYDGFVVYSLDGELYQCEYSITEDIVELGDPTPVKVSYVPSVTSTYEKRDIEVKGDLVQLTERAVRNDGTARVKLISPGWGSSGYYSKEMLQRDGPKVFAKGMHMYMNHPTEEEDRIRPERDLRDLAGVIESDVVWEDASQANTGDGLYANVKIFGTYRDFIDEAAAHIGTSIRAVGTAIDGEAEGKHGLIVDSLVEGFSVDYVTYPGRGGEILSLYESARSRIKVDETTQRSIVEQEDKGVKVDITPEKLAELEEGASKAKSLEEALATSNANIAAMQTRLVASEARTVVIETLSSIEMPTTVRERLLKTTLINVPLNEDKSLDKDKLVESVKEAATDEMKYIEAVTGSVTGGRVVGMSQPATTELNEADIDKELDAVFSGYLGNADSGKIAAIGRN